MLLCHHCQVPIPLNYSECSNKKALANFSPCYLTDPYIYYQRTFSSSPLCQDKTKTFIHPYNKYFTTGRNFVCNRVFCQKCKNQPNITKKNSLKNINFCQFCYGSCSCSRCKKQEYLIKLMGLYLHYGGNLP